MNNFEWSAGYGTRLGLVHVHYKTLKRTPKMRAAWFREAARRNAVVYEKGDQPCKRAHTGHWLFC